MKLWEWTSISQTDWSTGKISLCRSIWIGLVDAFQPLETPGCLLLCTICTKAKTEWEKFWEFGARGVHFSSGNGWQQNESLVEKMILKHLMISLVFIKWGASHYYKCWRHAYYEVQRRGILEQTHYTCNAAVLWWYQRKDHVFFWWKKCEVLHLIHEMLNDEAQSGNSWGKIWGCFPGNPDKKNAATPELRSLGHSSWPESPKSSWVHWFCWESQTRQATSCDTHSRGKTRQFRNN